MSPPATSAAFDPAPAAGAPLPVAWTPSGRAVVLACAALGLFLRLFFLSADALTEEEGAAWTALAAGAPHAALPLDLRALLAGPLLLLAGALGLSAETVLRGTPALAGAAGVLAAALLARRLAGGLAGMFAAALFAVSPALLGQDRAGGPLPLVHALALLLCLCAVEVAARAEAERGAPEAGHRGRWFAGALAAAAALGLFGRWGALALLVPVALLCAQTPRPLARAALPLLAAALAALAAPHLLAPLAAPGEYTFRGVIYTAYGEGPPALLHLALALAKVGPGALLLALGGAAWRLRAGPAQAGARLLAAWFALVLVVLLAAHPVRPEESALFLSPLLLFAAAGAAALVDRLRGREGLPTAASSLALLACALAGPGAEAFAAASTAPHPRLWLSPLAAAGALPGQPPLLSWTPATDIATSGLREAAFALASAEPNAEVASDQPRSLRLLLGALGRDDLSLTPLVRGRACRAGRVCYVVLQAGGIASNACGAEEPLSRREAWHEERLLGLPVVRVYRLPPGESPYPDENRPR